MRDKPILLLLQAIHRSQQHAGLMQKQVIFQV
jgi:hypothetical protein